MPRRVPVITRDLVADELADIIKEYIGTSGS